jgi:energy-coupling factor transport system substrate-specific component
MSNSPAANRKGLTVKDLVTIGIFSALLFITILVGGLFFAPNPVLTFYMPLGSALLGGPVFLLLIAKVPKRGPVMTAGILIGIIFFATGMHWAMDIGYIVMGIIADFAAGSRKYKSVRMNILAYMLFSIGCTGTYIMYFIDPASWASTMLRGGTEQAYIDTMNASAQNWVLAVILIGTLMVAAFSGWVGNKMLKKQFEKAGITA